LREAAGPLLEVAVMSIFPVLGGMPGV